MSTNWGSAMKGVYFLILISVLSSVDAVGDWDPEFEAQEQAKYEAQQRAEAQKKQETQKQLDAAQAQFNQEIMASKRETLGAAANGKSDAEVNRLYDAKIKATTEEANQAAQTAREQLSTGQGAAAVKQVTGKSMAELENMSDEEADAFAKEMEEKYGN